MGKTKTIKLTHGMVAIVDSSEYDFLNQWNWSCSPQGYAVRMENKKILSMHRVLMSKVYGDISEYEVDHKNRVRRDNRLENLRICSRNSNARNIKPYRGTSKYKGVSWNKKSQLWESRITVNGKRPSNGSFRKETHAAMAYDLAAHGVDPEFSYLNFKPVLIK